MTTTNIDSGDTALLLAAYQADDGLILDVLTLACQGMTYNPDGRGAPLVGYPFGSVAEMAREVVARLLAERDAAIVRADTEHAARVRLVEQYDALDAEAVAVKDALDAARAELEKCEAGHKATYEIVVPILNHAMQGFDASGKLTTELRSLFADYQSEKARAKLLEAERDAAIQRGDNFATEHSRTLLRVGVLEGLLQTVRLILLTYDGHLADEAELLSADIDAALAGQEGTG